MTKVMKRIGGRRGICLLTKKMVGAGRGFCGRPGSHLRLGVGLSEWSGRRDTTWMRTEGTDRNGSKTVSHECLLRTAFPGLECCSQSLVPSVDISPPSHLVSDNRFGFAHPSS